MTWPQDGAHCNLWLDTCQVDQAVAALAAELKAKGDWGKVSIQVASEFGRTSGDEGRTGTDHGGGGNTLILGGDVKGGRMLGTYPDRYTQGNYETLSRARIIPAKVCAH